MGLDITAYKGLKLVGHTDDWEEYEEKYDYNKTVRVGLTSQFPENAKELTSGNVYEYEDSFSFRAGSYSGYNEWRRELCKMVYGFKPNYIWNKSEIFKGLPFYELINFSDCEGVIDSKTSTKLLLDFVMRKDDALVHLPDNNNWFYKKYLDWLTAFEYGSDEGMVDFH